MTQDRALASTWKDAERVLEICLQEGEPERGLPVVAWLRDDALLAGHGSKYYPLAAAVYARTGKLDEAVALVHEAFRFGYRGIWRFDAAYGFGWRFDSETQRWVDPAGRDPHAADTHGIYSLHRYLQPLYANAEVRDIIARSQCEHKASWNRGMRGAPLCWLEPTTLNRRGLKCELSGESLAKGDAVMAFRYFNGSRDLPTVPLMARPEAFTESNDARVNAAKYHADGYLLADFAFERRHHHPWINAALFDPVAFDLDTGLAFLSAPTMRPTPHMLVSPEGEYEKGLEPQISHGTNRELIDFLWILVKSGHLDAILQRLPQLPRHFGLALMLFDRPALRSRIAEATGIPDLARLYAILGKPRIVAEDIAALARLGRDHAEVRQLLAQSLQTYEYHLYSNYACSPNWFFQDFRYFVHGRAGYLLYVLASQPDLLPPLATMLARPCLLSARDSGREYTSMQPFFYGVVLLHAALRGDSDLAFWRDLPDRDARWKRLLPVRKVVLKASALV